MTVLSVDLFNLDRCVLLSVTVLLVVSGLPLVLVNNDLPGLAVLNY